MKTTPAKEKAILKAVKKCRPLVAALQIEYDKMDEAFSEDATEQILTRVFDLCDKIQKANPFHSK